MMRHVMFALVVAVVAHGPAVAKGAPKKAPAPAPVQPAVGEVAPQAPAADKTTLRLAPPLRCDRITTADGLPNSNVHAIVQDKRGFMWLGTQDGLARYDGIKVRVYRTIETDPTSVSAGYITALTLDPTGKLWVGTSESGVNLYDPDTDKFTRFLKGGPGSLSSEGVTAIARDTKDRIWFAMSGGGLDLFDPATQTFKAYNAAPLDAAITAMSPDAAGNLWLGTQTEGVIRWNPDGGAPSSYPPTPDTEVGLGATSIRSILAASDGKIWIGSDGDGLYKFDPATKKFTRFRNVVTDPKTISDDHIAVLFEDRHKTLWVGTSNGLNHFDAAGALVRYQHDSNDPNNPTNLAFPAVEGIYQDSGGVMWVGGFTVGVCKFDEFRLKFGGYNTRTNTQSLFEDADGSLWAGSYSGLYHYDWAAQQVTVYHDLGKNVANDERIVLESVWMTAIRRDKKGVLWISMFNKGLVAFDPKAETYKQFAPDPDKPGSLPVDTIFDISIDDKGMLWLASWGAGLLRLDPETGEFTSFSADADDASGLSSNHLYKLYPDPSDKTVIWIGTAKGGLAKFNTVSGTATSLRHKDSDPASLSSDDVLSIYREPGGTLWVGTFGGGLNRIDPATSKAERFTTSNSGLTNNTVFGILADAEGKLWISTNGGGLLELDPKTRTFVAYEASDGLQDNEFSQGGYVKSKTGKLYFGGATGFNAFDPKDITRDPYVPPVVLTAFKVFNQDVNLGQPIWTLPAVEVSYSESFELQFAALSFAAPKKNRYAYKLEGFDDKFIETDRPYATYTKLGGGNYTLRVRASNQHGVWNEAGIALKLRVTPPFWRTWPAYIVYILLLAAAAYAVFAIQRQRLRRAEREGRLAVVERDLELTGAVQSGFLPDHNEIVTSHLHLFGFYRPADACSGDWWWHEQIAGGRHLIMVGDVTGHGPGPAMVTAAVATAFRVLAETGLNDVTQALELLNREVLRVAKGKYHMTMAALEVQDGTGRWILHSAGAPPMLSLGKNGKHKVHFCAGTPLGTEAGFEAGRVEGQLSPTDRILLYTDGIPEIALPNGNVMGMRRFAQQYERTRATDVKNAASQIVQYADQTQGAEPQADDWTFTMLEWR